MCSMKWILHLKYVKFTYFKVKNLSRPRFQKPGSSVCMHWKLGNYVISPGPSEIYFFQAAVGKCNFYFCQVSLLNFNVLKQRFGLTQLLEYLYRNHILIKHWDLQIYEKILFICAIWIILCNYSQYTMYCTNYVFHYFLLLMFSYELIHISK